MNTAEVPEFVSETVAKPADQAALFDIILVSATGFDSSPSCDRDPVNLLARGLENDDKNVALIVCAQSEGIGQTRQVQSEACEPEAMLHKVFGPSLASRGSREKNHQFHDRPDKVIYSAGRIVCFHDQLFNLKGGTEFVRASASAARKAGRISALICTSLSTAFFKRQEINDCFGGFPDCMVGEPSAILCASGFSRIDSLVPRLTHFGKGLILRRVDYPPIFVRHGSTVIDTGQHSVSSETFWLNFVPSAFDKILSPEAPTRQPIS